MAGEKPKVPTFFCCLHSLIDSTGYSQERSHVECVAVEKSASEDLMWKPETSPGTGHEDVLKAVNLPIVSNERCREMHRGYLHITNTRICAGGRRNEGVCEVNVAFSQFTPNYSYSISLLCLLCFYTVYMFSSSDAVLLRTDVCVCYDGVKRCRLKKSWFNTSNHSAVQQSQFQANSAELSFISISNLSTTKSVLQA